MKLRGIEFLNVMNAAGGQGFFGEGYLYHKYWRLLGLTFAGCGFVAKTTTFLANMGNMPLKKDGITPQEMIPRCIKVYFFRGYTLNAVGLSGPGVGFLLQEHKWQKLRQPFLLSFMAIGETIDICLQAVKGFVANLKAHTFSAPYGVEVNFSCPNVGLKPQALLAEIAVALDELGRLGVPLVVKLNATVSVHTAKAISSHEQCDALTVSNSIPWGVLPNSIAWRSLFGSDASPLAHLGGGGLSGYPLLPIVADWIQTARSIGLVKPIIACGGIMSKTAVRQVIASGADAIQLGVVTMLRPWRMKGIIKSAYKELAGRY